MDSNSIGLIVVGVLSLLGSGYAATQARKTNTATVDVRIFKLLQDDVVLMRTELTALRHDLREARDETDAERRKRIAGEERLATMERALARMVRTLDAAGIDVVSDEARKLLTRDTSR